MQYRRIRIGQIGKDRVIDFAVQELERYLKQMDRELNVDILLFDSVEDSVPDVLWVGNDVLFEKELPAVKDTALDDGIYISVKNLSGCITGTNSRSVLLGVYRFLKELGCIWVRPGKEGERIPQKTLENMTVQVKEAASYRHRGVCIEGSCSYENVRDMIDFLPKVGMNEYFVQFWVPYTFFDRWYFHYGNPLYEKEKLGRREVEVLVAALENEVDRRGLSYHKTGHGWTCEPFGIEGTGWDTDFDSVLAPEIKECLAQVNGRREFWNGIPLNTNLCYSSEKVRTTITDAITEYCKKNPLVSCLHFWLADDSNNQCECSECQKKRPSDWYVKMLNELDEKMTAASLNTKIVFLVYNDLLWQPLEERIKNPDRFIMMFAPISRRYGHSYGECLEFEGELPDYHRNQLILPKSLNQLIAHLRKWQELFDGDSFVYDYHLHWPHVMDPGYERCARNLFQDIKDLHKMGIEGMVSCQFQRCFFPTALPFYMMAAALWNENSDYETLSAEYYRGAFGEKAGEVQRYLCQISELMQLYEDTCFGEAKNPKDIYCADYVRIYSIIEEFASVIRENCERKDAYRKEWEILKIHGEYLKAFVEAFEHHEKKQKEECIQAAGRMVDILRQNEPKLQKVADVNCGVYTLGLRLDVLFDLKLME